jgi:GT2 family glycosyltransferase
LADGRIDSTGIALDDAYRARDRDRHAQEASTGEPFGVSGAAALWRRAALDAVGPKPWWEWLFVYWDDVEIAWRLRDAGWTFVCVPDATATHRRGSDTAEPDFVEAQSLRNRLATVARHKGRGGLLSPRAALHTGLTVARLAVRHPRALRRAAPLRAVRAGLAQRVQ